MTIKKQQGLNEITRYNLYPSAAIQGAPAAGYSSGQAMAAIREVAAETLDRPRAIEYLRRVAESTDPTAYDAVEVLIADANGQGWGGVKSTASQQQQSIMALRALGSAHRVTNQAAATLLDVWIGNHPA